MGESDAVKRWQVVAILAAVAALGGYFYLHRGGFSFGSSKKILPTDTYTSDTGLAAARPVQITWQKVSRPRDGFSVDMPSDPRDLQVPAYTEDGGTEPVNMLYSAVSSDISYAVGWAENPPVARYNSHSPDRILGAARDGMLQRTQTVLENEMRISVSGYQGREIHARNSSGGVLNARILYAGQRLYTLIAVFPSSAARRDEDVQRFFNSFTVSRPGSTQ